MAMSVSLLAQSAPGGMTGGGGMNGQGGSPTQPNQSPMQQQNVNGANDGGGGGGMMGQAMKDKMFLRKAAEGGMAEVQLGQLAAQKGSSEQVKDFGQKMVTDHTKLNEKMQPIAEKMGVKPPSKLSKKDQKELDKLNTLSGTDFDKEYLTYMVKDHHQDLMEFRSEMQATQDPTLKTAVTEGEHVIDEHAQMVDKLAEQNGISVPKKDQKAAMMNCMH